MKHFFTVLFLSLFFSLTAQEGELRINMWYGTVDNSDVAELLENEKYFKDLWRQQKEAGLLANWEMWRLVNPNHDHPQTTFVYVKFYTPDNRNTTSTTSIIPEGLDAQAWEIIQQRHLGLYKKIFSSDLSYKGGFNNSTAGSKPANFAIMNYMNVDWYKNFEYENMELKTFMPINKANGMKAWALTKVLDQLGTDRKVNYLTVDFYDSLEEIYTRRSNTASMSKEVVAANKKIDQIRSLISSDIFQLVDYLE